MWSQVNKFTVFFSSFVPLESFLTGNNSVRNTDLQPWLSEGQLTSLLPLNTFEHIFLSTAGPCPMCSTTTHCCLLTKHTGPGASTDTGRMGFLSSTTHRRISMPKLGGRGEYSKAELQIPHELDLCQQIKMFFLILCFYIYLKFL